VPFELGRPLGVPNDIAFQARVLLAALKLLEASNGPVIEDFPEEAPVTEAISTVWTCPVDLAQEQADLSNAEQLREALKMEIMQLRSWYDLAIKNRGRTTVGVSGLDLDTIGDFVGSFIEGGIPENPREDIPLGMALKLAVDDLKAYYSEAVTAQPGEVLPGSDVLSHWFWRETIAGKVLLTVKDVCAKSEDKVLRLVGNLLLVPIKALSSK
jgi:hypothetical protein